MLIASCLEADREYRQLRDDILASLGGRSLPFAACGLCDGAADALCAALLFAVTKKTPALCILSEERECNRMQAMLTQYGLRAAFFTARDLTFCSNQH